jgi:hypothetical protein
MIELLSLFLAIFAALFTLAVFLDRERSEIRDLRDLDRRARRHSELESDAAWRRNRDMLMQ